MSGKIKPGWFYKGKPDHASVWTLMVTTVLASAGLILIFLLWLGAQNLPDSKLPELAGPNSGLYLFDRNNHLICVLKGDENRVPVPLKDISVNMRQAMLAAEDHRFYSHHGLDLLGIGRAFLVDVAAHRPLQGASTITQQLAKNLFFKDEGRTFQRKIKEMIMAWKLEMSYPKDKILEAYLNQIYFGNGAYGIERASEVNFAKKPNQLSLSESAYLAGLVKAPSELSSPAGWDKAIERQHEILDNMVEYGYVSSAEAGAAKGETLKFKHGANPLIYPYYTNFVVEQLKQRLGGNELWKEGLMVYTNLDPAAQKDAERTLKARISKAPKGVSQAALVSISVPDGAIVAMVGGVGDFWKHQWNRAVSPHTAGSAFKPFVYLAALNNHTLNPDSTIDDLPLTVPQPGGPSYSPRDFDDKFLGPCTIRKALALSRNICAVRVAQATGVGSVIETARLAGITSRLDDNLSLALGSSAVSPLEMASAYSTLARDGITIQPQAIRRVDNWRGQTILSFNYEPARVFDAEPVAELVDALQDVVENGTGKRARLPGRTVAGKTGTADQARDIWFVGCTPDLVTAVWGGNDENLAIPGSNVTGGNVMAEFWHDYMTAYYEDHSVPPQSFVAPLHPLAGESDFRAEPSHPFLDALQNFFGGSSSRQSQQDKPHGNIFHRMFKAIGRWF